MFADQWSRVVVASVAPVVVISASGLLCLAFYNRLAAIVSRLRSVQRERLQERAASHADSQSTAAARQHERLLENLALQTNGIVRRARLIRLTLLCLLATVANMVLSSVMNGIALLWPPAAIGAAILFLFGMACLLCGVIAAMMELLAALDVVKLESQLVTELTDDTADDDPVKEEAARD